MKFEQIAYPAFIEKEAGEYGIYFPTLLPDTGWEYPLSTGSTKKKQLNKQRSV